MKGNSLLARAALIALLLCVLSLFRDNVEANELHKFIEALAVHNPDWLPGAFKDQPDSAHRQWLYQLIFAPLLDRFGFLAISIAGRLAAYVLLAVGLALVTNALGLRIVYALGVTALMDMVRSMAAGEWIIGGVEPKVFSYGLVFVALAAIMRENPPWVRIALLLALATALHVLVGLYATWSALAVWVWEAWRHRTSQRISWSLLILIGAVAAAAAIPAYVHFTSAWNAEDARLYISLRVPHHLDPTHWSGATWRRAAGFIVLFAAAGYAVSRVAPSPAQRRLLVFCAAAAVPFIVGLAVLPFDLRWQVLSFYPFRFADVMIPFGGLVLAARALQSALPERIETRLQYALAAGLLLLLIPFARQVANIGRFPIDPYGGVTEGWFECTQWIRANTPPAALFVVPPIGSESFPWLARRRALAVFKHTTLSGGLREWEQRLTDMAGWVGPWPSRGWDAARWIARRYECLSTEQAQGLMQKYDAAFFVTRAEHALAIPVVYSNAEFIVYSNASAP